MRSGSVCRGVSLLLCAAAVLATAGCAGKKKKTGVQVKGRLVGMPLKEGERFTITFATENETYTANGNSKGEFETTPDGVPPGHDYKVAIQFDSAPSAPPTEGGKPPPPPNPTVNRFHDTNMFFTRDRTPLTYTVTDDAEQTIQIDIGKRTVTKIN